MAKFETRGQILGLFLAAGLVAVLLILLLTAEVERRKGEEELTTEALDMGTRIKQLIRRLVDDDITEQEDDADEEMEEIEELNGLKDQRRTRRHLLQNNRWTQKDVGEEDLNKEAMSTEVMSKRALADGVLSQKAVSAVGSTLKKELSFEDMSNVWYGEINSLEDENVEVTPDEVKSKEAMYKKYMSKRALPINEFIARDGLPKERGSLATKEDIEITPMDNMSQGGTPMADKHIDVMPHKAGASGEEELLAMSSGHHRHKHHGIRHLKEKVARLGAKNALVKAVLAAYCRPAHFYTTQFINCSREHATHGASQLTQLPPHPVVMEHQPDSVQVDQQVHCFNSRNSVEMIAVVAVLTTLANIIMVCVSCFAYRICFLCFARKCAQDDMEEQETEKEDVETEVTSTHSQEILI